MTSDTPVDMYREIWEEPTDIGLDYEDVAVGVPEGPLPA